VAVPNRYTAALRSAADTAGGEAKLAFLLGVPQKEVHAWLVGDVAVPFSAFLDALDIIADGPLGPRRRRRIRVAVLTQSA
jgi:hypothetical protein